MLTLGLKGMGVLNGRNCILIALPRIAMDWGEIVPTAGISIVLLG